MDYYCCFWSLYDVLSLLAIALCKGIGFSLATPLWVKLFDKLNIYLFSGSVTILAALFPFFLIGAQWYVLLLYLGYGLYGIMQAGSELSWHMSGPVFSRKENSTPFSSTNILMVGVRGCIFPSLGTFLYSLLGSTPVMFLGSLLCTLATVYLFNPRASEKVAGNE